MTRLSHFLHTIAAKFPPFRLGGNSEGERRSPGRPPTAVALPSQLIPVRVRGISHGSMMRVRIGRLA